MVKQDIFKKEPDQPPPLVGPGSIEQELEKKDEEIKKHSQSQSDGTPLPVQQRRNKQSAEDKIKDLARKSTQILFQLSSVFPFDFFPDTLTINANKIDIVRSNFFFSHYTTSIPIRNIANVQVESTPFFATLKLINIRAPLNPVTLNYLKKDEAEKAKKIIDGLLVATEQGADISSLEPKVFLPQLERLGESFG